MVGIDEWPFTAGCPLFIYKPEETKQLTFPLCLYVGAAALCVVEDLNSNRFPLIDFLICVEVSSDVRQRITREFQ